MLAGRRRRGERDVGHDLDVDAAQQGVEQAGADATCAGVQLAGGQQRHHLREAFEHGDVDVDALLSEEAFILASP